MEDTATGVEALADDAEKADEEEEEVVVAEAEAEADCRSRGGNEAVR